MSVRQQFLCKLRKRALEKMVTLPDYMVGSERWPDGEPKFWCNVASRDLLDATYETKPPNKGGLLSVYFYDIGIIDRKTSVRNLILSTNIKTYCEKCLSAAEAGTILKLSEYEILEAWDQGEIIHLVSPELGHEAIVSYVHYESPGKIFITVAQCGKYNGYYAMTNKMSFEGGKIDKNVFAFVYPLLCEGLGG